MSFKWTRPIDIPYPSVWLRFKAKDVDTDDLVEYTIEDLPEDRFDEAIEMMARDFLADAPLAKLRDAVNDSDYVADNVRFWKVIVKQRMAHVCFKEGSREIFGIIMNYVICNDEVPFLENSIKSAKFKQNLRVFGILFAYGNFDVYKKYSVDKYLSSFGMCVPKKFARRKIGEKLLEASKYLAKPCDIKIRHAFFTSDNSNKIADNLGYKTDIELSYTEMHRCDQSLQLDKVESNKATLRTWIFERD